MINACAHPTMRALEVMRLRRSLKGVDVAQRSPQSFFFIYVLNL